MIFRLKRCKSIIWWIFLVSMLYYLVVNTRLSKVHHTKNVPSKSGIQSNSTHLWNMRVADENYFRLAKLLPCRIVDYGVGQLSTNTIDSCIQPPTDEFSHQTTLDAQKWIFDHQNPTDCTNKRFAILRNIPVSGFGSTIHLIAWAFGRALGQDRIAVYETPGDWFYGDCNSHNPDCVFLPISNCSYSSSSNINTTIYIDANTNRFPECMPRIFQQRSFLWYRSQLMFYLLRYNHRTLAYVQHKIAESFVPSSLEAHNPYISIYVRRSDKVLSKEMQQSYSLKQYFDLFYNDSLKGNIRTIYLNSEDPTVFTEFKELNQNHYKLLTIKTKTNLTYNIISSMSQRARGAILRDFLTDLYIEIHADLHSGTLTSNYCRLVDALRLVLGKTIPFYTPENRYFIDA